MGRPPKPSPGSVALIAPGAQPSRVASQPFECVIAAEPLRAGLPNDSGCEHGNALNATSHHQGAIPWPRCQIQGRLSATVRRPSGNGSVAPDVSASLRVHDGS